MKMLSKLAALATIATLAVIPSAHAQMDWDGAWIAGGEIYMTDRLSVLLEFGCPTVSN